MSQPSQSNFDRAVFNSIKALIVCAVAFAVLMGAIWIVGGAIVGGIDWGIGCEKGDAATARQRPECRNVAIDEEHAERGDLGGPE